MIPTAAVSAGHLSAHEGVELVANGFAYVRRFCRLTGCEGLDDSHPGIFVSDKVKEEASDVDVMSAVDGVGIAQVSCLPRLVCGHDGHDDALEAVVSKVSALEARLGCIDVEADACGRGHDDGIAGAAGEDGCGHGSKCGLGDVPRLVGQG